MALGLDGDPLGLDRLVLVDVERLGLVDVERRRLVDVERLVLVDVERLQVVGEARGAARGDRSWIPLVGGAQTVGDGPWPLRRWTCTGPAARGRPGQAEEAGRGARLSVRR